MMPFVCLYKGMPGNSFFQCFEKIDVDCHVASDEMYKCGVESLARPPLKYIAKLATSWRCFARAALFCI